MKYKKIEFQYLLPSVLKPARYLDHELNSYRKNIAAETVNFCLAFPDVYEVGFSHLGLKILYTILNEEIDAVADRVYAPWPDFAKLLLENEIPLFGIESGIALKNFDVVGFTLQTELTYTNILKMLQLAEIPLLNSARNENQPLIIAGGPCASNPLPLSDFIDVFLIGDGEEAIIEIKNVLQKNKSETRKTKLEALSEIEGIYVPQISERKNSKVKIRKFMNFSESEKTHSNQLVPWMEPTHLRYVSEIMRGCSRGCRFCHAGYFYRPVREKKPEIILDELLRAVKKSGWDETALSSLSSSDYSQIKPLLFALNEKLSLSKTSISLPSLRVDTIDDELTQLLNAMHQSGLTIAPEAGTQRLRDVINKNISEAEIVKSVEMALKNGWQSVKLYFMIGLPFETDTDIDGIVELVEKIVQISQKKLRFNITISPFVPKVFTPFQWSKMEDREVLRQKAVKIKKQLAKFKFIKVKYHEISSSLLECVLGRGDKEIGKLLFSAFENGAQFDGWNEYFDFSVWQKSARETDIDLDKYLHAIPTEKETEWEKIIDIGMDRNFLLSELEKSGRAATTVDCRTGKCTLCGLCSKEIKPDYATKISAKKIIPPKSTFRTDNTNFHYRCFYGKIGEMSFVAHLDMVRMFQRILRISDLPIVYSHGFNIHPRLSAGPPLPIGVQGENEYFDFMLSEEQSSAEISESVKNSFPDELQFKKIESIPNKKIRRMEYFEFEEILITPTNKFTEVFSDKTELYRNAEKWLFTRIRKRKEQQHDLKKIIVNLRWDGKNLLVFKKRTGASIFDVLKEIYGIEREKTNRFQIIRKQLVHLD